MLIQTFLSKSYTINFQVVSCGNRSCNYFENERPMMKLLNRISLVFLNIDFFTISIRYFSKTYIELRDRFSKNITTNEMICPSFFFKNCWIRI